MKFTRLETKEQFENLKKGDFILVQWSDYTVKHTQKCKKIMAYSICENKTHGSYTEIICKKKFNHYFNYMRYLDRLSGAEEVYLIKNMEVEDEKNL